MGQALRSIQERGEPLTGVRVSSEAFSIDYHLRPTVYMVRVYVWVCICGGSRGEF